MNKNVELLESVLSSVTTTTEDTSDLIEESVYQELDEMIYEEIRSTLRKTILESADSADEKVKKIEKLEEADITEEQAKQYMEENYLPIFEACGLTTFEGDNPVFVDGIIYEMAIGLDLAKRGQYKTMKNIIEAHDEFFEIKRDVPKTKEAVVEAYIQSIFEHWGITTEEDKKSIISEANEQLEIYGTKNLLWSLNEAVNATGEHDLIGPFVTFVKGAYERVKGGGASLLRTMGKQTPGAAMAEIMAKKKAGPEGSILSRIWKNVRGAVNSTTGKIAIGAALLGLIATYLWKRNVDKCKGLTGEEYTKCYNAGIDETIAGIKNQMKYCKDSSNPKKCMDDANKLIAKWEAKKK